MDIHKLVKTIKEKGLRGGLSLIGADPSAQELVKNIFVIHEAAKQSKELGDKLYKEEGKSLYQLDSVYPYKEPKFLGGEFQRKAEREYRQLDKRYQGRLDEITTRSFQMYCQGCAHSAAFVALSIEHGLMPDNERNRLRATPKVHFGELDIDVLRDHLGNLSVQEELKQEAINPDDIMRSMGLYLLNMADSLMGLGKEKLAFAALGRACEAFENVGRSEGWDAGYNSLRQDLAEEMPEDMRSQITSDVLSAVGRKAALARHAKHREMKEKIFSWYEEKGYRYKSMDAAAEAAAGDIVPVAFRTVREWISEYKKLRSARRT